MCVVGSSLGGAQITVGSSEWMVLVDLSQEDVNRLGASYIGSEFERDMYYGAAAALELLVGFGHLAEELRSGQNLMVDLFHVINNRSNIVELFASPSPPSPMSSGYFAPTPAMTSSFGALGSAVDLVLLADRLGSLAGHTLATNPPFCPGPMAVVQRLVATLASVGASHVLVTTPLLATQFSGVARLTRLTGAIVRCIEPLSRRQFALPENSTAVYAIDCHQSQHQPYSALSAQSGLPAWHPRA